MVKKIVSTLLVLIFSTGTLLSQEKWISFTNCNFYNDLAIEDVFIWAATEGGVVKWNLITGEYIKYTNTVSTLL